MAEYLLKNITVELYFVEIILFDIGIVKIQHKLNGLFMEIVEMRFKMLEASSKLEDNSR